LQQSFDAHSGKQADDESRDRHQGLPLLNSSFLLRQLMLRAAMATILGHHVGAALAPPDAANVGADA